MRRVYSIIAMLALCGGIAFSQGQLDAYRFGQTELSGTARYVGMGGAFGALGGDISVMNANPAGLAVYRSSEVVTTLGLSFTNTKTNWLGATEKMDKTKFNFDNIAYVGYFPTSNDVGIVSWNAGFSYNRLKNFNRRYSMRSGRGAMDTSLSDYVAARASGTPADMLVDDSNSNHDPYDEVYDWLSVIGYNADFIKPRGGSGNLYNSAFEDGSGNYYLLDDASLSVRESGAIDQYNISFGMNISDIILLGAGMTVTDISYKMYTEYDEGFANGDYLWLDNMLETDGSGYGVNVGVIVRPVDYLRLGVAYNSPTWYKMTDYFYADAESSITITENGEEKIKDKSAGTPNGHYDYDLRSPDKWIFSAAAIIGQAGLISVDYEMVNYKSMHLKEYDGASNVFANSDIRSNFKMGSTLRVGAEARVTPQFTVRAGGAWSNSPVRDRLKNGTIEVVTVGTLPNYTIDKGNSNYTVGLGYRFTPQFYADMACVFTSYKEDVYAFSGMTYDGVFREAQKASLKTNRTRMALTVGYKF